MKNTLAVAIAASIALSSVANATLVGSTLQSGYFYPDLSTPHFAPVSFTVGTGVEAVAYMNLPNFSIDVAASTITIFAFTGYPEFPGTAPFSPATFNGLVFTDSTDSAPAFLSVTVDPSNTLAGFTDSRVTFSDNQITLNFASLSYDSTTQVVLSVTTVPEPACGALFLLGAAFCLRRRSFFPRNTDKQQKH